MYIKLLNALRGPIHFEDMIFYLWSDSNEITFYSWKIFDFWFSFWENYDFPVFWGVFFG